MRRARFALLLLFAAQVAVSAIPLSRNRSTDFTPYREAAIALIQHQDPYADSGGYLYPPLLAVLLTPFVSLPPLVAASLWAALSAAAISGSVYLLAVDHQARTRLALIAVFYMPFAATQWNHQVNGFVLLLFVLTGRALEEARYVQAGVWLGLSLAIKPFALFFLVWLLLTRRLKALITSCLVLGASFFLVLPFRGLRGVWSAVVNVVAILRRSWPEPYAANISLNGALDRVFTSTAGPFRHALVGAVLVAAAIILTHRRSHTPSVALDTVLAATLLGASTSWLHHSAVLFRVVARLRAPATVSILALYCVASGWRVCEKLAGSDGSTIAAATGTCALLSLFALSGWPAGPGMRRTPFAGR